MGETLTFSVNVDRLIFNSWLLSSTIFALLSFAEPTLAEPKQRIATDAPRAQEGSQNRAAAEPSLENFFLREQTKKWSFYYPYTPEKREWGFELGTAYERRTMYYIGGFAGFHVGRCFLFGSGTCQQYFDFIFGLSGSEDINVTYLYPAIRWQNFRFPRPASPSYRIFAGTATVRDWERSRVTLGYGAEYAWSVSVHPKIDLRSAIRFGVVDQKQNWLQLVVGINPRLDRWIGDLSTYSWESVKAGGNILKKTVTAPIDIIDDITSGKPEGGEAAPDPKP